ncbi:hypothetical protein FDJ43_gp08 [Microbacterium phage Koji]|uniref:Uncharacterized protein n=1 Tax=Microbacterium phage Koji TaxID=2099625 RepID=A0A2P1CFF0_9CAUD|nr:hypothetical protein FDJ43_gp08 [Microbacterium phage Koji]AVJ49909.1 hypothetical protein PBI_KOJI_8 [Microbacterium phage Koji]
MAIINVNAVLTGGWGAHENARARKDYYTWRRMQGGTSVKLKLSWFTSQYNRTGYCGHWANLAYKIRVFLRNSSNSIVSTVDFNDEQQGVTKNLYVPSTGNYAYSFELFHPGDVYTTQNHTLPPYCHLEQYYSPDFRFESTFTTNTN